MIRLKEQVNEVEDNKRVPDKEAVALRYDPEKETAPRVIAKGRGYLAEQILAAAKKNAVPIYQNQAVSGLLMAIELDREVPPELYQAVANVLAYVYKIDNRMGKLRKK